MRIGFASVLATLLAACGGGGSEGLDGGQADAVANASRRSPSGSDLFGDGSAGSIESSSGATLLSSSTSTSIATGSYTLLAWNDLGMHCVDGKDYSVFSILPPYNNLHAQLVDKSLGQQVTTGITLTYEAMADSTGSINTSSAGKTNFWTWVQKLFGVALPDNVGLAGNATISKTPRPMTFNATNRWFEAEGIPVTPYDDKGVKNFYPMVKVVAKNASGKIMATARTVLPVSDEMSCKSCHASTVASNDARPAGGWVNDSDPEKDWKKNILRLHDEKHTGTALFQDALANAKVGYSPKGLSATANGGQPVLCAACHSSNALPGTGVAGISPLTQALHTLHAKVNDPNSLTPMTLDSSSNRTSCYLCHPGSVTQCLRGPMGNALDASGKPAMNCQSCHGSMSAVGSSARTGWLNQPTCQSCHHDGKREISSLSAAGVTNVWADQRFASNADTPAAGLNLYRFSKGHGKLQCESCHGATHAEYPSSHVNDNVLSQDVQGHAGTINECTACHKTVPLTVSGGPHGMHTTGNTWVEKHHDYAKGSAALASCAYCHGADYRGTALSQVKVAKTFVVDGRSKTYVAGQKVGCYDCHNGPWDD